MRHFSRCSSCWHCFAYQAETALHLSHRGTSRPIILFAFSQYPSSVMMNQLMKQSSWKLWTFSCYSLCAAGHHCAATSAGHLSWFNLQRAEHHTNPSLPHGMGRELGEKTKIHEWRWRQFNRMEKKGIIIIITIQPSGCYQHCSHPKSKSQLLGEKVTPSQLKPRQHFNKVSCYF